MKKSILIALIAVTSTVNAGDFVSGKIDVVRTHSSEIYTTGWAPPEFWFTIKNVSSAGTCKIWHDKVLFVGTDKQMLAMIMSAYLANKPVSVQFNDTQTKNTFCLARYVSLSDSPPLY